MSEITTAFVGLDVHKDSIAIAVAQPGRAAPRFLGTTGSVLAEVEKALSHLGAARELLIVYEAGPCGYGLARQLRARGYRCEVIAPTLIPHKPAERRRGSSERLGRFWPRSRRRCRIWVPRGSC